jgi:hypothetical protein
MSRTNATINSTKGTSTLVRARFGPGMLLQHEDLEQLNLYTQELSRLLFRSFFGCGVVCGLVVTRPVPDPCGKLMITVGKGLALDCSGDPVYVPKDQSLALDEKCEGELPTRLWVILCRDSKCCAPRNSVCASDEEESSCECTRLRDLFEIRIVRDLPKCICGCLQEYQSDHQSDCDCADPNHPCYRPHYQGECDCDAGEDCGCCCECVLLAQLDFEDEVWSVTHRVRRFIRPVLIQDPQVVREQAAARQQNAQTLFSIQQQQLAKEREDRLAQERLQRRQQDLAREAGRQKTPKSTKANRTPKP